MKLKNQLLGGFAAVIGVFVLSMVVVGVYLNSLVNTVTTIKEDTLPFVVALDQMDLNRSEVQQFLTDVSATHDQAAFKEADEAAKSFMANVGKFRDKFRTENNTQALAQIDAIAADFEALNKLGKKMAYAYIGEGIERGNDLMKGTDKAPGFDQASEKLKTKLDAFRQQQMGLRHIRWWIRPWGPPIKLPRCCLVGGLISAGVAGVMGVGLASRITGQLGGEPTEAVNLAKQVGSGDLSTRVRLRAGDSTSLMANLVSHAGKPGPCGEPGAARGQWGGHRGRANCSWQQ
jgi:methyl-accepting chemotaxis protein